MIQLMKYRFLSLLRDRTTMFWSLLFPLILCTLFYVTFGNIDTNLECIDTAVVVRDESRQAKTFQTFLGDIEEEAEDLIKTEEMTDKKAKSLLKDGKICGIFYIDKEPELLVAGTGVEESVLQSLLESYQGGLEIVQNVSREKPENLPELMKYLSGSAMQAEYVKEASLGGKETDGMIQYFFSLIAMTCMFGCFLGFEASMMIQANIYPVGARRCLGATGKMKIILSDFILICVINFVDILVLLGYMTGVLKLDLGDDIGKIILVSFVGCLIGVAMGMLVGSVGKWKEGTKIAILLAVSLGSSFLSGLMVGGIKGLIEEYCPIINRINPSALISDAFYSMTIYEDASRYTRDVLSMAVWAVIFLIGSFFMVRRVRYDSI